MGCRRPCYRRRVALPRLDPALIETASTADQVAELARDLLGAPLHPERGLIHVSAVWRATDRGRVVMRIGPETPRSAADSFLLNLTRAMAGGIVVTGKLLRDEPTLHYALQGPGHVPEGLLAWRREVAGLRKPPHLVVLTSGRGLDPTHPAWRGWARPVVFTDAEGHARLEGLEVPVVAHPEPSARAAIDYLRTTLGVGTVTVEAGPTAAQTLYEPPAVVDHILLSTFEGPAIPDAVKGGRLFEGDVLETGFECATVKRWEEPSGPWSFAHYVRRQAP